MSQFPFQPQPQQPAPQQPQQVVYGPPAQTQQYAPQPYAGAYAQQNSGQPIYAPGYGQQPPVPQAPPPVAGTLDAFNSQPSGGGGPTLSWDGAPLGYTIQATVARTVTDRDVQQDTDFRTKMPKTFRDGRPQLVLIVPIVLAKATQRHPDGRASMYVKSGLRDALAAGMEAAGAAMPPKEGDQFQITLEDRKDTGQGNPKNIFRVQYHRPGVTEAQPTNADGSFIPTPSPQQPVGSDGQPVPHQGYQQRPGGPILSTQTPEVSLQPAQNQTTAQADPWSSHTPAPQQAPAQPQASVSLPQGLSLSPEQQALLARLQGGGQS